MEKYDEEYFEMGTVTGKSCYSNYHWMPEKTIRAVHYLIEYMGLRMGDSLLDFGCAKGYYVKAFRMLGIDAFGVDISEYAISQAPEDVRKYVGKLNGPDETFFTGRDYEWFFTKDTLEHMEVEELGNLLADAAKFFPKAFHIIPLGNGTNFYCPENNNDTTHQIRETYDWWIRTFAFCGWRLKSFTFQIPGIKEEHYRTHPEGHGFFLLERIEEE